jgi:hypothetical protein
MHVDDDEPHAPPYGEVVARRYEERRRLQLQSFESLSHYLDVQFERRDRARPTNAQIGFANLKRRP